MWWKWKTRKRSSPPKFPPENFPYFQIFLGNLQGLESLGNLLIHYPSWRTWYGKIEEAKKTIEATAKGLDAVGNLDADTLMKEGPPSP